MNELKQTMTVRMGGKKWTLPQVLPFGDTYAQLSSYGWHFYEVIDYRQPKKDEYYLSGAPVEVWRALNDMHGDSFLIVHKTTPAKKISMWVSGEMPPCPSCESTDIRLGHLNRCNVCRHAWVPKRL